MIGAPSVRSSQDSDALTYKAIAQRESIAKNYNPIISPSMLPMLQLKQHGDCTIADPRACLHHYDGAADLACLVYVHISRPYFEAMIHAGLIVNKTRVVLRCTENDAYKFVIAQNLEKEAGKVQRNVEELLDSLKSRQGNCRPGVELLTMEHVFVEPRTFQKKRGPDGKRISNAPPVSTTYTMNGKKWAQRLRDSMKQFECHRTLHSEQKRAELNCRTNRKTASEGRTQVPILVIEAPWMLKPNHPAS
jgi:hypothetical protein